MFVVSSIAELKTHLQAIQKNIISIYVTWDLVVYTTSDLFAINKPFILLVLELHDIMEHEDIIELLCMHYMHDIIVFNQTRGKKFKNRYFPQKN